MNSPIKKKITTLLLLTLAIAFANGQEKWKLKVDKEGIRIFAKRLPNSGLDALRIECNLNTTLSQMVAVILDVPSSVDWVYSTKSATLLKQVSPSELFYYSEVNVPWPVSNRDFVAHIKVNQDPKTKVVTVIGDDGSYMAPEKKGIVRVKGSLAQWVFKAVDKNTVFLEYTLITNPGGSIPDWLMNMFATKAPFESFRKLKLQLQKPAYRGVQLAFINNVF